MTDLRVQWKQLQTHWTAQSEGDLEIVLYILERVTFIYGKMEIFLNVWEVSHFLVLVMVGVCDLIHTYFFDIMTISSSDTTIM